VPLVFTPGLHPTYRQQLDSPPPPPPPKSKLYSVPCCPRRIFCQNRAPPPPGETKKSKPDRANQQNSPFCRNSRCTVLSVNMLSFPRCTCMQYSGSVRPSVRTFHVRTYQTFFIYIYPGRSLLDSCTFPSSAAETAQSAVTTLRVQDPWLQFSRLPDAQSGCGTSHVQLRAADMLLADRHRTVLNGMGCKTHSRVTTSTPQPNTLIITPNGCN